MSELNLSQSLLSKDREPTHTSEAASPPSVSASDDGTRLPSQSNPTERLSPSEAQARAKALFSDKGMDLPTLVRISRPSPIERPFCNPSSLEGKLLAPRVEKQVDVVGAFVDLAKEEGHDVGDDAIFVVNIGNATDKAEHYRLSIAIMDYIHFMMRDTLARKKVDILSWWAARDALFACGITPTRVSSYVLSTGEQAERYHTAIATAEVAASSLMDVCDSLSSEGDPRGETLKKALSTLGLDKRFSVPHEDSSHQTESDTRGAESQIHQFVDGFQRFCSLCENGEPLMKGYERLAKELFNIVPGKEMGYVVLSAKHRPPSQSREDFIVEQRKNALVLTRKLREKLYHYAQLHRLSLHIAACGEVIPMGYIPEEKDVVTIDSEGVARTILSVTNTGLGESGKLDGVAPEIAAHILRTGNQ